MSELLGARRGNDPLGLGKRAPVMTWADLREHLERLSAEDLAKPVLFAQCLAMDKPELYKTVFVIAREEIDVDEWGEPITEGTYFLTDREPDSWG